MKEIFYISLFASLISAWIGYLYSRVAILKLENKLLKGENFAQEELINKLKNYNSILSKRIKNINNH